MALTNNTNLKTADFGDEFRKLVTVELTPIVVVANWEDCYIGEELVDGIVPENQRPLRSVPDGRCVFHKLTE